MRLKKFSENLPAILYAVYILKTNLTNQDIYAIQNKLRQVKEKYPYVSYLLAISNTDSKYCIRRKVREKGKKGRPKEVVLGNKIGKHVHLSVLGDESHSAYKCIKDMQKTFNRRFGKGKCIFYSKGNNKRAKNFINYSLKQANHYNKDGIFNFILEKCNVIETEYL